MSDDGFTIDLDVKGGDATLAAANAVAALTDRLTMAGSAAAAAADALKAGQTAYNQAESGADRAAKALEKIGLAADAQRGKLAAAMDAGDAKGADAAAAKLQNLVSRQAEAATKASAATAAMNAEAAALDRLKAAAGVAADNEKKLTQQLASVEKASKAGGKATATAGEDAGGAAVNLRALSGAFGKLGGPIGSIGQTISGIGGAFQKFSKLLGDSGPYVAAAVGIAAVAAAAAVAAVAFIAATVKIGSWAVGLADAARTQGLLLEGIGRSAQGGRELATTMERLGNQIPLTSDELQTMASKLADTGLRGQALNDALEESAIKAAKLKFGPDFAKQMLSINVQTAKLKSNISSLFGGLKIEPLLEGLQKLVGLFDQNEASGKAIKVVFESMFQPLIDGVVAFIPKATAAFLQFEILVLKALIAIKPFSSKILFVAECFGILAVIVAAMATGFAIAIIAPFAVIAGLAVALIAGMITLGEALLDVGKTALAFGESLTGGVGGALEWLEALSLNSIGGQLIQGLVDGITSAGPAVLNAITGIASGAVDAAKKALGIASPSKIFAEIGMHTAAGMEEGVDSGADGVQSSMADMVAPPTTTASGGSPAATTASGKGGRGSLTIEHLEIHASGNDGPSIAEALRNGLQDLLVQMNGSPSPA